MEKQLKAWKTVAVTAICLLLIVSILYGLGLGWRQPAAEEQAAEEQAVSGDEMLTLWTADSAAKAELTGYIEAVTDESGAGYIPVERRIAVFDLDGTLFCETDPNYFDYTLLVYRVLEDPDYRGRASAFERETALKIVEQNRTGASFSGLEVDHGRCIASAFAGMTPEEFSAYIQEFKKLPMPGYEGMTRGEGWYLPMLQVVEYLQANDFTVYVVSGTDRFIVRGIVQDSPLRVPPRQIIGSDETLVASNQGDTDGLNYVFTDQDKLILGGEFLIKNLKMNKVTSIQQEIGVQPVLSFGNSTGDSSMAEFVTTNNPYPSLAFMLCCDDTVRENGNEEKANKMYGLCEQFDWVPVSMKNDWTSIYGEGVSRKAEPDVPDYEALGSLDAESLTASAPALDEMKFDDGVDLSAEDGADSVERDGDHAESPYFNHLDFYNLESTDTLTILPHFKTIQQSSEWSCGVASSLMVLEWYGRRGEYTEESLAALRPQGLQPGATSLSEMVAMFEGVGGFNCYSAIDAGEDVYEVFTFDFIRDTLAAGDPIMIGWNDWGGHWQVLIGYDSMGTETTQDDVIIVADPYDTTDHNQDGYGVYGAERFLYNFTFYNFFEGDELNDMCFLVAKPA